MPPLWLRSADTEKDPPPKALSGPMGPVRMRLRRQRPPREATQMIHHVLFCAQKASGMLWFELCPPNPPKKRYVEGQPPGTYEGDLI